MSKILFLALSFVSFLATAQSIPEGNLDTVAEKIREELRLPANGEVKDVTVLWSKPIVEHGKEIGIEAYYRALVCNAPPGASEDQACNLVVASYWARNDALTDVTRVYVATSDVRGNPAIHAAVCKSGDQRLPR